MGSSDAVLESGVMSQSGQAGEAPAVWIKSRDGRPLAFGASDTITIDIADLQKHAEWPRPQLEVVEAIGESATPGRQWKYLVTEGTRRTYEPPEDGGSVSRLIIRLLGLKAGQPVKAKIEVELTREGQSQLIEVPVDLRADPPTITTFRARPSIVVTGDPVTFAIECERTSSWTVADAAGQAVASGDGPAPQTTVKESRRHRIQKSGETGFRLTARGAGGEHTADIAVKVQEAGGWIAAPQWWSDGQVAGLCVSPAGDVLYALVRFPGGGASVWWSADGVGRWEKLADAPAGMVARAPAASLRLDSGVKLVFAGGSKVDPTHVSSTVRMLDVKTKAWSTYEPRWEPRKGHACVVALDRDGKEKLWLIGGVDANGNALSDVQVSADGEHWDSRPAPEWAARCMLTATVKESEIWVGGGFKRFDGTPVNDIWTWKWDTDTGHGGALEAMPGVPVRPAAEGWRLSALALTMLDSTIYIAGVERLPSPAGPSYRSFFGPLESDRAGYVSPTRGGEHPWLERAEEFRLEAVAFNGCIWLFSQRSPDEHVIASGGLYCWVPSRRGTAF